MNRVASLIRAGAVPILAAATCCCSSTSDPLAEGGESLRVEAAEPGPRGGTGPEPPAEHFRGCREDEDCVAVPVVGCCHNGWKASVSREMQHVYAHSFVCPTARPICPQYLVRDTRAPRCNASTQLCELVPAQCTTVCTEPFGVTACTPP